MSLLMRMATLRCVARTAALLFAAALAACASPFLLERADLREVLESFSESALVQGTPNAQTRRVLRQRGLEEAYASDPLLTLEILHDAAVRSSDADILFALAELCYLAGDDGAGGERDLFLSSAVYAWFFLFGQEPGRRPSPYDVRLRLACDYYNHGLSRALFDEESGGLRVEAGQRHLLLGRLEYDVEVSRFPWNRRFDLFLPADHYDIRGLAIRNWYSGLGVPLVATNRVAGTSLRGSEPFAPSNLSVAATAVLHLRGTLADLARSRVQGTLEVLATAQLSTIELAGAEVPLARDLTAPLAHLLSRGEGINLELRRFFGAADDAQDYGLYILEPYQPGRVPVVFVHGTASSPARWADMYNHLVGDDELRHGCQFWIFTYPSGQPILQSAADLRSELLKARATFDPSGRDAAFAQTVLIGHSQGGLLTRLATSNSDGIIWAQVSDRPLEEQDASEEEKAFVRRLVRFEALPFVTREIFVCTPHRGSVLAAWLPARIAARFISLPTRVLAGASGLLLRNPQILARLGHENPTSIHAMEPGSLLVTTLERMPLAPFVHYHSIIAIDDPDDEPPEGGDGVVAYTSAHLDGAESEFLVTSGHSCQANPLVIEEVRRILRLHLRALVAATPPEGEE